MSRVLSWLKLKIDKSDLFKDVNIPTKEDFQHFDTNADGVLFYEEWLNTLENHDNEDEE